MSSHILEVKPQGRPKQMWDRLVRRRPRVLSVRVGWDRPMSTYYAIVLDTNHPDGPNKILWLGQTSREISDPADVIDAVSRYAVIPEWLYMQLLYDPHN